MTEEERLLEAEAEILSRRNKRKPKAYHIQAEGKRYLDITEYFQGYEAKDYGLKQVMKNKNGSDEFL